MILEADTNCCYTPVWHWVFASAAIPWNQATEIATVVSPFRAPLPQPARFWLFLYLIDVWGGSPFLLARP